MEQRALSRLQRAHDDLKNCPFRVTLDKEDLSEYITQLWELSDAWSNLCYHVDRSEDEQKLFKDFCSWLHDYNSLVGRIRNADMEWGRVLAKSWLPYFEAMLNVTHTYLDTGSMNVFYNPVVYSESGVKHKTDDYIGERWCLVTEDMCGIDSPELPRYFPVTLPLCTNTEKMKKYFLEKRFYGFKDVGKEQRLCDFEEWERNVRPILLWVNKNLVPKAAKENGDVSMLHYAVSK